MFFDVHSHTIEQQSGGLILSIEGAPAVPGGQSFEAWQTHVVPAGFYVVPYVAQLDHYLDQSMVYLHPRRNGFGVAEVVEYLRRSKARLVVLDTFHKFVWQVQDYVAVVRAFPEKTFLLAHGGGYDVREFAQIIRYHANCWIDFSATQSIFGCTGGDPQLDCGARAAILHALAEPRIRQRVLFGSDNPEFSQQDAVRFYASLGANVLPMLAENYHRLMATTR